jgi:hypothetical protein
MAVLAADLQLPCVNLVAKRNGLVGSIPLILRICGKEISDAADEGDDYEQLNAVFLENSNERHRRTRRKTFLFDFC